MVAPKRSRPDFKTSSLALMTASDSELLRVPQDFMPKNGKGKVFYQYSKWHD